MCCTDGHFDVCVNYSGGATSLTINKSTIEKDFTNTETIQLANSTEDIFIGTFIVEVNTDTFEGFDVVAFTSSGYVGAGSIFQALPDDGSAPPCLLSLIGNKTPEGTATDTAFFNGSVVITHAEGSSVRTMTLSVNTFMLGGQVEDHENTICYMPINFAIEGL